jgi:hypothetical protein
MYRMINQPLFVLKSNRCLMQTNILYHCSFQDWMLTDVDPCKARPWARWAERINIQV